MKIITKALTAAAAVLTLATSAYADNMGLPAEASLYKAGDKVIGASYLGYWAGGINISGSYFLSDNLAIEVDVAPLSYNYGAGNVSILLIQGMGVYHAVLNDKLGWYAGIGFGMGSASYTLLGVQQTVSASGLAYTGGLEMPFSSNLKGHIGYNSGGIEAGVNMTF